MNRQQRISLDRWLTTPPDEYGGCGEDQSATMAHAAGWQAHNDGEPIEANPHDDEYLYEFWEMGWQDAADSSMYHKWQLLAAALTAMIGEVQQ